MASEAEGQGGAPSAWAQGEAQRLLDEAGYGYPTQEPRTYVRAIVARALDAARAEGEAAEREALKRERAEYRGHGPLFVDATPDGGYAIRLLTAYADADAAGEWVGSMPDSIAEVLNDANRRRCAELRGAIARLSEAASALRARGEEAGR